MADRALGSGLPIPQWMRKPASGFDPSSLSPPTCEDDFFQIHFTKPKTDSVAPQPQGYRPLGDVLAEQEGRTPPRPRGIDDGFHGSKSACASSVVECAKQMLGAQPKMHRQRRNSKSLPASPLGSPETRRRLGILNRFFTTEDKDSGGSTSSILEALNRETRGKSSGPVGEGLLPQPSELREMNFWSPTSM